jgi:hypothetical protein
MQGLGVDTPARVVHAGELGVQSDGHRVREGDNAELACASTASDRSADVDRCPIRTW